MSTTSAVLVCNSKEDVDRALIDLRKRGIQVDDATDVSRSGRTMVLRSVTLADINWMNCQDWAEIAMGNFAMSTM